MTTRRITLGLVGALGLVALHESCSHTGPRRFALADPLWEDADRNHVSATPSKYYSGMKADVADKTVFRPLSQLFAFPIAGDARNVNAVDEVPNSSWFTNRIGLHPELMTPAMAARGACDGPPLDPRKGPWLVVNAKPDGANPGFFIKAADGRRYLLKFDGPVQPQRATAADVIGSRIYHAAGFFAPCNQIVYFERAILEIAKDATATNAYGEKQPITNDDVERVLAMAYRRKNGLLRASASAFLPGKPIGPWTYQGTRNDDPNDVIPHEDRRELRGARLLAAWLNHFDAREQNTLDIWFEREGRRYIRHYYIDFGDCFGSRWEIDAISRRLGHSYYLDFEHVFFDIISLGAIPRPWNRVTINEEAEIFGYYSAREFVPSSWRVAYPNPAFDRMNHRDALWMARIIERFTDAHIRAIVAEGKLTNKRTERTLVDVLIKRRDLILAEYLTQHAPLDHFRLVRRTADEPAQSLCFKDLAIQHQLVAPERVLYKLRMQGGERLDQQLGWLQFEPDPEHPARSCVLLPFGRRPADLAPRDTPPQDPRRYAVITIRIHQKPSLPPTSSVEVHLYDLGPEQGFRMVGLVRPPRPTMPDLY